MASNRYPAPRKRPSATKAPVTGTPLDYVPIARLDTPSDTTTTGGAFKATPAVRAAGWVFWLASIVFIVAVIWTAQ